MLTIISAHRAIGFTYYKGQKSSHTLPKPQRQFFCKQQNFYFLRSVIGVFTADNVRRRLANLSGSLSEELEKFTIKKFYKVDLAHKPTLGLVSRMLDIAPYVVVVKSDASTKTQSSVGLFTSENLLKNISTETKYTNGS